MKNINTAQGLETKVIKLSRLTREHMASLAEGNVKAKDAFLC